MADLKPLDAGQLIRLMTADLGRPPTPQEGTAVALALRLISNAAADAVTWSNPPDRPAAASVGALELRQLARHLISTIGLALEATGTSAVNVSECGSMLKLDKPGPEVRVIQCNGQHRDHDGLHGFVVTDPGTGPAVVTWTDADPRVLGF